jgi:hypothetical protein
MLWLGRMKIAGVVALAALAIAMIAEAGMGKPRCDGEKANIVGTPGLDDPEAVRGAMCSPPGTAPTMLAAAAGSTACAAAEAGISSLAARVTICCLARSALTPSPGRRATTGSKVGAAMTPSQGAALEDTEAATKTAAMMLSLETAAMISCSGRRVTTFWSVGWGMTTGAGGSGDDRFIGCEEADQGGH